MCQYNSPLFKKLVFATCKQRSVQFSLSVVSDFLWPCRLQQAGLPCSSPTPGACLSSCPLSWWCHLILCHPLLLPSIFPSIRIFSSDSVFHKRWPKYWSFSFISPSNEHSGLISFRMDWFDTCCPRDWLQESSPTSQFKSTNSFVLSSLYRPTLTSIHDY